jgi:hypothetical protein
VTSILELDACAARAQINYGAIGQCLTLADDYLGSLHNFSALKSSPVLHRPCAPLNPSYAPLDLQFLSKSCVLGRPTEIIY